MSEGITPSQAASLAQLITVAFSRTYISPCVRSVPAAASDKSPPTALHPAARTRVDVEVKADSSPVTIADKQAEAAMRQVLDKLLPGSNVTMS